MRLGAVPVKWMRMLVMLIVPVRVHMVERFMNMLVVMPFSEMQPNARTHQQCGEAQRQRYGIAKEGDRNHRPDEGTDGEVGPSSRRSQMP